jgi:hypothetical protein
MVLRDSLFGTYVTFHRLRACLISFFGGSKKSFLVLKSSSTPERRVAYSLPARRLFNSHRTSGTGRCCGYWAKEVCH